MSYDPDDGYVEEHGVHEINIETGDAEVSIRMNQPTRRRRPLLILVLIIAFLILVAFLLWKYVYPRIAQQNITVQGSTSTAVNPFAENRDGALIPTEQPPQGGIVSCPLLPIPQYVLNHEGGHLRTGLLPEPQSDGIRRYNIAPIVGEAKVYPAAFDQNLQAMHGGQPYNPELISMSNGEAYNPARHMFASWYYPLNVDPVVPEAGTTLVYSLRYQRPRPDGTIEVIVVGNLTNSDRGPSANPGSDLPNGIARITQAVAMRLEPEACVVNGGFNPACYDKVFTLTIIPACQ